MNAALHPSLAPLMVGGGAPERLAIAAGEMRARMEHLLWAPLPRLLDDDVLTPLTAPLGPGDTLEAVLARLAGDGTEADLPAGRARPGLGMPGEPVRIGAAALPALPADIAAHARALPQPPARVVLASKTPSPVFDVPGRIAVAGSSRPDAGHHRTQAQLVGGRDWQVEAARLGADRPLRIAAEPLPDLSVAGRAGPDGGPTFRNASPSPASVDANAEPVTPASAWGGDGATSPDGPLETPSVARPFRQITSGSTVAPLRRASPIATGTVRDGIPGAATLGTAATRPRLHAVTMPEGAHVGGFAGLAALGRAASPEEASAVRSPAPVRIPANGATARTAETTNDRAPSADAQAVIAELADVLRLQILAAGIDLSGRRS